MKKLIINNPIIPQLDEQRAELLYNDISRHFWPIVGTANHLAMTAMFDCYDMFERDGLLVYSVKRDMNTAAREYDKYMYRVRRELKDRFPLWSDVTRLAASKMQPKVDALSDAIKMFFEKNNIDNVGLRVTVCTTDALIQNSCAIFDALTDKYQKMTVYDITSGFKSARMTGVHNAFRSVAKKFLHTDRPEDLNLNLDKACMSAINDLLGCFLDVDSFNDACHEALILNPKMKQYAKPDEYNFFEKDEDK